MFEVCHYFTQVCNTGLYSRFQYNILYCFKYCTVLSCTFIPVGHKLVRCEWRGFCWFSWYANWCFCEGSCTVHSKWCLKGFESQNLRTLWGEVPPHFPKRLSYHLKWKSLCRKCIPVVYMYQPLLLTSADLLLVSIVSSYKIIMACFFCYSTVQEMLWGMGPTPYHGSFSWMAFKYWTAPLSFEEDWCLHRFHHPCNSSRAIPMCRKCRFLQQPW